MAAIEELSAEVDRAEIIASVEQAAALAASRSTGLSLRARLDAEKGHLVCYAVKRVAKEVQDPETEVGVEAAPDGFSPGDLVEVEVPFGTAARSAARAAGAVLEARLGAARMLSRAERFRDRVGKLETAIVARREGQDLIVNLGPVEGRLPADEQSRHEVFNPEETIRVAVHSIEPDDPPVILSRIAPAVLAGLIERETPEVRRGVVQVRAVARHPGIRAKVAVSSAVPGVDPVAACLGPGGSRIRAVSRELRGERVDVVLWDQRMERFARNALRPAEVLDISTVDEESEGGGSRRLREKGGLLVTVSEAELPRTLGKRGQNVRLASELLGVDIEVVAEGEAQEADERRARRDAAATDSPRRGPRDTEYPRRGPRDSEYPRRGSRGSEYPRRGPRDTESPRRGPRDSEYPRRGPRDTESPRRGPRDSEYPRRGPRDSEYPRRGPRDSDSPRRGPRDSESPHRGPRDSEYPRRGPRDSEYPRRGPRDSEYPRRGPRDSDSPRRGPRDSESPRRGPRDSEYPRRGPRDSEYPRRGPRDSEYPRRGPRDSDSPRRGPRDTESPRRGPRDSESPRRGPRDSEYPRRGPRDSEYPRRGPRDSEYPRRDPRDSEYPRRDPRDSESPRRGPRDSEYPRRGPRDSGSFRRNPDKRRGEPGAPSRDHGPRGPQEPRNHKPHPQRDDRPDRVRESAPESEER